jgi:hypothetical protein
LRGCLLPCVDVDGHDWNGGIRSHAKRPAALRTPRTSERNYGSTDNRSQAFPSSE